MRRPIAALIVAVACAAPPWVALEAPHDDRGVEPELERANAEQRCTAQLREDVAALHARTQQTATGVCALLSLWSAHLEEVGPAPADAGASDLHSEDVAIMQLLSARGAAGESIYVLDASASPSERLVASVNRSVNQSRTELRALYDRVTGPEAGPPGGAAFAGPRMRHDVVAYACRTRFAGRELGVVVAAWSPHSSDAPYEWVSGVRESDARYVESAHGAAGAPVPSVVCRRLPAPPVQMPDLGRYLFASLLGALVGAGLGWFLGGKAAAAPSPPERRR